MASILTAIIIFQLLRILYKPKKNWKVKLNYLSLTSIYLVLNLTNNLLPNKNVPLPVLIQLSIECALGLSVCLYTIWYLYTEFNISTKHKIFKIKNLIRTMALCYVLLFILPLYLTRSIQLAYTYFLIYPIILAIAFVISFVFTARKFISYSSDFKFRTYLALSAIVFLTFLPVLTWFHVFEPWIISMTSISFLLISVIELDSYLYRIRNEAVIKLVKQLHPEFTDRENEIALQIIKESNYKVIAKHMFIAESTVRKHASNIFSKSNCSNRSQFISKFKKTPL
ncbi:response regulator transcription factor [Formosa agariphila]|nr:helix-turn-helix transcriptional regulator [Formosa agariphila]